MTSGSARLTSRSNNHHNHREDEGVDEFHMPRTKSVTFNENVCIFDGENAKFEQLRDTREFSLSNILDFFLTMQDGYSVEYSSKDAQWFCDMDSSNIPWKLSYLYLAVRLFIVFTQSLLNGCDFSTDAFKGFPIDDELYIGDRFVKNLFGGFGRWDGVHMLHIAHYGYLFENSLAFFPGFPLFIRHLTRGWVGLFIYARLIHLQYAYLLTAVLLNMAIGFISLLLLFNIVLRVSKSTKESVLACLVYIFNPATIFFTAAYSESIFFLFTLAGIYALVNARWNIYVSFVAAVFCFSISYFIRSNGLLNIGYIVFYCGLKLLFPSDGPNRTLVINIPFKDAIVAFVRFAMQVTTACLVVPLMTFHHGLYQKTLFCNPRAFDKVPTYVHDYATSEGVVVPGQIDDISWCSRQPQYPFLIFYSDIQEKYWDVRLFGYWQFKKLPCFFLAAPAIYITMEGLLVAFSNGFKSRQFIHHLALGGGLLPYAVHTFVLVTGAMFMYNVEVYTRILFSSSPFVYMVLARWIADITPQVRLSDLLSPTFFYHFSKRGLVERLLVAYLFGYCFIGSALHVMWLPFT